MNGSVVSHDHVEDAPKKVLANHFPGVAKMVADHFRGAAKVIGRALGAES